MKSKILSIAGTALILASCSPDGIDKADFSNYSVDRVVCEASGNFLVADNISELDLQVKLYAKTGTYEDRYGETRDLYMEIPKDRWRGHEVKYYVNGKEISPPYKTSDASPGTLQCYATVDGIRSEVSPGKLLALYPPLSGSPAGSPPAYPADPDPYYFEVTLRAPYTPPARRIPVVFHVIDEEKDSGSGQVTDSEALMDMIDLLNKVYGRKNSTAPGGANANIEFVAAKRDPSGVRMADPGVNRVIVREEERSVYFNDYLAWIWNLHQTDEGLVMNAQRYETLKNNGTLPVRTPKAFWNPDCYLNIWILSHATVITPAIQNLSWHYFPVVYPENVFDPTEFPVPAGWDNSLRILSDAELAMWKNNPYDLRLPPETFSQKNKQLGQAGIFISKHDVTNYGMSITQAVGAYFGLLPNASRARSREYTQPPANSGVSSVWLDDLCDDTPVYNRWFGSYSDAGIMPENDGSERVKYTMEYPYFSYRSTNIMESGSSCSSITQDQVRRMQWVLENAPGRQMWKDTWAIDD